MTKPRKLKAAEIRERLKSTPGWRKKGAAIHRRYEFDDFVDAMKFVNAVAKAAERAWHHPDIDIRWNRVSLSLSTHDVGGLSENDFELAAALDRLARR
ncbi:MAG: 4a-hydroxytetrahydrobiopterin dehydratase [Verrucomicrobia bacterium]|nr:4a-hydroxytetrahydrobiopterin dehydratase [Verrucomicrobiota bacterium]MBI3869213.1 4a-hydroxytetrahydrobiopterin dehydratase [Verrucomicrobiota bacterium]